MNGWGKGGARKGLDLIIKNSESSGLVLSDIIKATMMSALTYATLKKTYNLEVCYGKTVNHLYFYQLIFLKKCSMFTILSLPWYFFFFALLHPTMKRNKSKVNFQDQHSSFLSIIWFLNS